MPRLLYQADQTLPPNSANPMAFHHGTCIHLSAIIKETYMYVDCSYCSVDEQSYCSSYTCMLDLHTSVSLVSLQIDHQPCTDHSITCIDCIVHCIVNQYDPILKFSFLYTEECAQRQACKTGQLVKLVHVIFHVQYHT